MKSNRRLVSPLLFVGIVIACASAFAAPPEGRAPAEGKAPPPKREKDKDVKPAPTPAPTPTPTTAPTPAPTPTAPASKITTVRNLKIVPFTSVVAVTPTPVKGWPHTILTATPTSCFRAPAANEVIVYKDSNFGGACAVLTPGFYPYAANLFVGNDAISSIKVGSGVRARGFADQVYGGSWTIWPPNTVSGGLGGWNDRVSSMRIEPANRSQNCNDLQEGEIALFESAYGTGDCVVLPGEGGWANAEAMGIENDSITSVVNNSAKTMWLFWDPGFTKGADTVPPHSKIDQLYPDGFMTNGIDNSTSSIQMR